MEQPTRTVPEWVAADAEDMVERQRHIQRADLPYPEMSDFQLANELYLVDRFSLELIHYQTAAKERMRWLSVQLADALAKAVQLEEARDHAKAETLRQLIEDANSDCDAGQAHITLWNIDADATGEGSAETQSMPIGEWVADRYGHQVNEAQP